MSQKTDVKVYEIDLAAFTRDRAAAYSIFVGCPPFAREVDAKAMGLDVADDKALKSIIKEGRKCLTLPDDDVQAFVSVRNKAKRTLQRFSTFYPFIQPTTAMIQHRIPCFCGKEPNPECGECHGTGTIDNANKLFVEMNKLYSEFESLKEDLIERLPKLRDAQRSRYIEAANIVFDHLPNPAVGRAEFVERYMGVFERAFPTERNIRVLYVFNFQNVGSIQRSISLMSREEFLKDAKTSEELAVMKEAKARLRTDVFDWIAATAASVKIGLFRAVQPVVEGMRAGNSIGKREVTRIEEHVKQIMNFDIFGDKDFDALATELRSATAKLKADIEDGAAKSDLQLACLDTLKGVEKKLQHLEFDPTNYRRLELDGDENIQEAFADKKIMAEISERMNVQLALAVKELAEKGGGSDAEKKESREKLALSVKLSKLAQEAASEMEFDVMKQAATIDTSDEAKITVEAVA